jgi:hypothetical protein
MSEPDAGRRARGTNDLIDTAGSLAADVGRLGYGLLSLGLGLLPRQTRTHMHNAVHELSHAFVRLPGDFAAIAGEAIEEWAAEGERPAAPPAAVPENRATAPAAAPAPTPAAAPPAEVRRVSRAAVPAVQTLGVAPAPPVAVAEATVAPVTIAHIEYDPPGRDVDGEYVLLRNTTAAAVDMGGWRLHDGKANHSFVFPAFTLAPGGEVKIWTKRGTNDAGNLFWGERSAIWNNDGDTGTLKDAAGAIVSRLTYAGSK